MNAAEHLAYLASRRVAAVPGSLRASMYSREGVEATDAALAAGLRVWAIERRRRDGRRAETTVVFGRSGSDALRRASTPARLGEAISGEATYAAEILTRVDEPIEWPRF